MILLCLCVAERRLQFNFFEGELRSTCRGWRGGHSACFGQAADIVVLNKTDLATQDRLG